MVPFSAPTYTVEWKKTSQLFLHLFQSVLFNWKPYLMAGVASWMYYVCSCIVVLWYIQYVCPLMLNLCTLVRVLISTPPGFWWLCMSLYSDCNLSPALPPVVTHLLVGHCLHGTSDLYWHLYCWSAAQLRSLSRAFSTVLPFYPCVSLPLPPSLLPTHTRPHLIPYTLAMLSLCLLPQGTHAQTWKPLSWARRSCMCWSWSWRHWSCMDCIHFIDVVQQLLAAGTRSTKEWQWQKKLRWECAHIHTHKYTCVYVLIA